jgi:hypothetical protein
MANSIFIFCSPAEVYKGMKERDVARAYERMAIQDYDKFVSFYEDYEKWKETSDITEIIGKKQSMPIVMQGFCAQDVSKFGNVEGIFVSSSFLFNPKNKQNPNALLPDLDIVEINGENNNLAAQEIERFYQQYGWRTSQFTEKIETLRVNSNLGSRYRGNEIQIYSPDDLIKVAKEIVGYDSQRLCWREQEEKR